MPDSIIYFTRTNSSKKIAEKISDLLDIRLEKIRHFESYKGLFGYIKACSQIVGKKKISYRLPKYINLEEKKIIVSPIWLDSLPPLVDSLVEQIGRENIYLVTNSAKSTLKDRLDYLKVYDIIAFSENEEEMIYEIIKDIRRASK